MPILSSFGFGSFAVTTSRQGAAVVALPDARRYFYELGGGDWFTVGDWYKNQNHTIAATAIPNQTNNTIILSDCTASLDDNDWVTPASVEITGEYVLTLSSTSDKVFPKFIDIVGTGWLHLDGVIYDRTSSVLNLIKNYFFNDSDDRWMQLTSWFKNEAHTTSATVFPEEKNDAYILSDCTADLDDQNWVFPGHVYIAAGKELTLHSTQVPHPVWPGYIDIDGPGGTAVVTLDGVDNGADPA